MDRNTVIEVLSNFNYDYVLTDEEIDAVGEAVIDLEAIRDGNYIPRHKLFDIQSELWMEGMNMTGEYQGVWVRFRDIEKVIAKHLSREGKE